MKHRIAALIALTFACLVAFSVTSANAADPPVKLFVGSRQLQSDVPPMVVGGRTLVPVRVVTEALGAKVQWDGPTQTISILGARNLTLQVGSERAAVDGQVIVLDAPPVVVDGRTLVPIRFIAETFGFTVGWDPAGPSVHLTRPDYGLANDVSLREKSLSFRVDRDEQDWTIISGSFGSEISWAKVTTSVAGLTRGQAVIENGRFSLRLRLEGGTTYPIALWGTPKQGPNEYLGAFEVAVPAGAIPHMAGRDGLLVENLILTGKGITMTPSFTPNGELVLEGQAPAGRISLQLFVSGRGPNPATYVQDGRYRLVFPLAGPDRFTWSIYHSVHGAIPTNIGQLVVAQTRAGPPGASTWKYLQPSQKVESDHAEILALARTITAKATTDMEKARAVHDWVTANVTYDIEKYLAKKVLPGEGALLTLRTKIGVCRDYAWLTAALLRAAGVPSRVALGEAGGYGDDWEGHAWVEAMVDNRWLTMDTTWDAGGITNDRKFISAPSTRYFDPDPEVFKKDHLLKAYE